MRWHLRGRFFLFVFFVKNNTHTHTHTHNPNEYRHGSTKKRKKGRWRRRRRGRGLSGGGAWLSKARDWNVWGDRFSFVFVCLFFCSFHLLFPCCLGRFGEFFFFCCGAEIPSSSSSFCFCFAFTSFSFFFWLKQQTTESEYEIRRLLRRERERERIYDGHLRKWGGARRVGAGLEISFDWRRRCGGVGGVAGDGHGLQVSRAVRISRWTSASSSILSESCALSASSTLRCVSWARHVSSSWPRADWPAASSRAFRSSKSYWSPHKTTTTTTKYKKKVLFFLLLGQIGRIQVQRQIWFHGRWKMVHSYWLLGLVGFTKGFWAFFLFQNFFLNVLF